MLLVSLVIALCPEDPGCPTVENPPVFDPIAFDYVSGDYHLIDWKTADYTLIPAERVGEIPVEQIDFSQLSEFQLLIATADQLAYGNNLEKVNDLTKLDFTAAQTAISQKYKVDVTSFGNGANIIGGMFSATYGEKGNVAITELSPGTKVLVDEKGRVIVLGETKLPAKGSYTASYKTETEVQVPTGEKVKVQGNLKFTNGQAEVEFGEKVIINGVQVFNTKKGETVLDYYEERESLAQFISGEADTDEWTLNVVTQRIEKVEKLTINSPETVKIYFDDAIHEGSYLSINNEIIHSSFSGVEGQELQLKFLPQTDIFDVEEKDYLAFSLSIGTSLDIKKRPGMIPKVKVSSLDKENGVRIFNGNDALSAVGGELYFGGYYISRGGVPLVLESEDILIPSGNKIIFDNSDNYIIIPSQIEPEATECLECAINLKDNKAIADYYLKKISSWQFQVEFSDQVDAISLQRIYANLDLITPELLRTAEGGKVKIIVVPTEKIAEVCGTDWADACAYSSSIYVSPEISTPILMHELAHIHHMVLDNKEPGRFQGYILELSRKYLGPDLKYENVGCLDQEDSSCTPVIYATNSAGDDVTVSYTQEERTRLLELLEKEEEPTQNGPFTQEWEIIVSRKGTIPYGRNLVSDSEGGGDLGQWASEPIIFSVGGYSSSSSALFPCVRAYGCRNVHENIATSVESYTVYKDLINPDGKYYSKRIGKPVMNLYTGKYETMTPERRDREIKGWKAQFDLLYQNSFLTRTQYCEVVDCTK